MKLRVSLRRGFTLIELLVSITIMSFILVLMGQMITSAQSIWRTAQNRIDNFNKARSMLDLITDDLQNAVFRGDLPVFGSGAASATPTAASDGLHYFTATSFTNAFYTRRPGATSTNTPVRDISLVSYGLNSSNVLQRSDLNIPWSGPQNLSFQGNLTDSLPNATAREVAPGVVGFRLMFRRADGTLIDPTSGPTTGYTGYNPANPVVAVNFGLAVIGKETLGVLNGGQIDDIKKAFAEASISNGIKASWDQQVLTPSFYSTYPKSLGSGLKTFERWVACTPF